MIKFLQINLANWAAEQPMAQTTDEIGADIFIVSEPATPCDHEDRWCFSTDRKAAVGTSLRSYTLAKDPIYRCNITICL